MDQIDLAAATEGADLRVLAAMLPDLVFVAGTSGAWAYTSDRCPALAGRSGDELIRGGWLDAFDPPDRDDAARRWRAAVAAEAPFEAELRVRGPDGAMRWVRCRGTPVRRDGRLGYWVGTCTEIPDPAEERLRLSEARAEAIEARLEATERRAAFRDALDQALLHLGDPLAMMRRATESLGRHLGAARVGFGEVAAEGDRLAIHGDWTDGRLPSLVGTWPLRNFGRRFVEEMMAGETVLIEDVREDPRTRAPEVAAVYESIGTRAMIDVPLVRDGRIVAFLFVHHPGPRPWTAEEAGLARETCARLWPAVERAHAEAALRRSEAQARAQADELAAIYAAAPVGLCVLDAELRYVRVNERLAELNGLPAADHIGRRVQEVAPGLGEQAVAALRRVLAGEEIWGLEITGTTAAQPGVARCWRENWLPLRHAGGAVVGVTISAEEITTAKAAEAALRASEARLHAITDSLPQIVWSALPDGYHDFYNRRWYEFTGVPEGSTDGEGWNGIFHPEDQPKAWERWRHSLATGAPYEIEYRLRHHSGEYRWVLGRALPVRDDAGAIMRWIGTCTDTHEIIETRRALAESRLEVESAKAELEARVAERTAELRRANARLGQEMQRREAAQAALAQSQKLEALGQLTSGIAHDFNNVIAAISGGFSVIRRRTEDPRLLEIAAHGEKAAERGGHLVKQLLAFARQQALEPRRVDLAALLREAEPLLRRSLGSGTTLLLEEPEGCRRC